MFEKEAEEYVIKKHHIDKTKLPIDFSLRCEFSDDFTDFQKGAEFVYNKCNTELTKAKKIIQDLIDSLEVIDGEQIRELKVKEAEQFISVIRRIDNMPNEFKLSRDILGLWEQTVCKIRAEIKTQDTPALVYAKELCDKLEQSMCALAGGHYSLRYSIE